jgi:peptide/nickel transport system ATP-binding protein
VNEPASDASLRRADAAADAVPLLELRGVTGEFRTGGRFGRGPTGELRIWPPLGERSDPGRVAHALERTDFAIAPGEIAGVVGAALSARSTLARIAAGLRSPDSGERLWRGRPVDEHARAVAGLVRIATGRARAAAAMGRLRVQFVGSTGSTPLDPRRTILDTLVEAPIRHRMIGRVQQVEYAAFQLNRVGVDPMAMRRRPDAFSPAERLRIAIARALARRAELLVCDDALAGLDIPAQAQLLNLLLDLRASDGLAVLFAGADLRAAAHACDRIAIMEAGHIVESGPTAKLLAAPAHAHTRALVNALRTPAGFAGRPGPARAARPEGS